MQYVLKCENGRGFYCSDVHAPKNAQLKAAKRFGYGAAVRLAEHFRANGMNYRICQA